MKNLKPTNQELQEQLDFYKITLNDTQSISNIGSWKWNVLTNEVIWSNMMFILLGLKPNELKPSYELALQHVHDKDKKKYERTLEIALKNKTPYYLENRIIKTDHSVVSVISRGKCFVDEKGDLIKMIGTVQDISILEENKKLIHEKMKAEENERIKNVFLANMSHEIRTPMNAVLGFASLLEQPNLIDSEKENFIKLIHAAGNRLLSIISDIVDISKIDAKQIYINDDIFNLNKFINNLHLQFSIQQGNGKVSLHTTKGLPDAESNIHADELRLMQIMSNLLENAQKFTKEGRIEFGYSKEGDMLQFYVKDSGIGIHPANHKIIFERFKQVHKENTKNIRGTGLGLSIAKGIVQLLKGKIWIESEENNGATFYFTIPYKSAEEKTKNTTPPESVKLKNKSEL